MPQSAQRRFRRLDKLGHTGPIRLTRSLLQTGHLMAYRLQPLVHFVNVPHILRGPLRALSIESILLEEDLIKAAEGFHCHLPQTRLSLRHQDPVTIAYSPFLTQSIF